MMNLKIYISIFLVSLLFFVGVAAFVDSPGYMATYKNVHLENNVYQLEDKKLVWSAASETFDPQDVNKAVKELAEKIIRRLKEDKLLKS